MPKFAALLSLYRQLSAMSQRHKERSEYQDDRAFWSALGVVVAVVLGFMAQLITDDPRISTVVATVSSGVTIPIGRRLANYFWTKKIEHLSLFDRYLDTDKLFEDELRREVARIRMLQLTKNQETQLLIEAYRENLAKKKSHLHYQRAQDVSNAIPEVWNYTPADEIETKKRLVEEDQVRKLERAEKERAKIEKEIQRLQGRT